MTEPDFSVYCVLPLSVYKTLEQRSRHDNVKKEPEEADAAAGLIGGGDLLEDKPNVVQQDLLAPPNDPSQVVTGFGPTEPTTPQNINPLIPATLPSTSSSAPHHKKASSSHHNKPSSPSTKETKRPRYYIGSKRYPDD